MRQPWTEPYSHKERISLWYDCKILHWVKKHFSRDARNNAIAQRLPRDVVYWAVIRAGAEALGPTDHPDDLSLPMVLKSWSKGS